jgi:hypothetical protein
MRIVVKHNGDQVGTARPVRDGEDPQLAMIRAALADYPQASAEVEIRTGSAHASHGEDFTNYAIVDDRPETAAALPSPECATWSQAGDTKGNVVEYVTIDPTSANWAPAFALSAALDAAEPAKFTCRKCGEEEHPVVPGEDGSVWCPCGARLDEQRDRIAEEEHDFETEGRQDEGAKTKCAVCGLYRSAMVHRW